MSVEAVVLTGGKSERMGADKSNLLIEGEPLGRRTARLLAQAGCSVTVLGQAPIEGFRFLADESAFEGALMALARFQPTEVNVFVAACDMPRFDARIVDVLQEFLGDSDAAVPILQGQLQPTCALYSANAWSAIPKLTNQGKRSLMAWVDSLSVRKVDENELQSLGLHPTDYRNANTRDEFQNIITKD